MRRLRVIGRNTPPPLFKKVIIHDDWKASSHFGVELVQSRTESPSYDIKAVTKNKA